MRMIIALIVGVLAGAAAVFLYGTNQGRATVKATGDQIETTTKSAREVFSAVGHCASDSAGASIQPSRFIGGQT